MTKEEYKALYKWADMVKSTYKSGSRVYAQCTINGIKCEIQPVDYESCGGHELFVDGISQGTQTFYEPGELDAIEEALPLTIGGFKWGD